MPDAFLHYGWVVLRILLLAWLGLSILLFFRQSSMVFVPNATIETSPSQLGLLFDDIVFRTRDNETLNGWFVPAPGANVTFLLCHGNGGNISDRVWAVKRLHDAGFNTFVFDYRGYGRSTGNPSETGLYLDARAAWDYLTIERGVSPSNIVIHGRSLGGAVACELATNVNAGALILEATFTSLPDLASKIYPYLPVQTLCRFRFNTLRRISHVHIPLLVAHSREDDMIPFAHGERIFQSANEPKAFGVLRGDHNSGEAMDDKAWLDTIHTFISKQMRSTAISVNE